MRQPQDWGGAEGTDDPLASYSVLAGRKIESAQPGQSENPDKVEKGRLNETGNGLEKPLKFRGSDQYVKAVPPLAGGQALQGDGIVLNFENADLREVVRTILGDFLKISYIYDPKVQGSVSLQTTRQLTPEAVLATLETLLRMNGAALVAGDPYRVVTAADAPKTQLVPQLGNSATPLPPGFRVIVAPLQYVSATQMEKLLEPFAAPQSLLRVDVERNLLVLAGTSAELGTLIDTIGVFDVDWLAGQSIGLFPLSQVTPEDMMKELDAIFGTDAQGPLAGLIRFQPINRLNALLVVSAQSAYLDKIEQWITRLDRSSSAGQNLYVFYLQNGKAKDIADILTQIFAERDRGRGSDSGKVAPGRRAVELQSANAPQTSTGGATPPSVPPAAAGRTSEGLAYSESANIKIIADEVNNSLLILASPPDYRMVVAAINKLDIVPLQVLIEATIAEVKLTDDMRFGLQWFFKSGNLQGILRSGTVTGISADVLSSTITSGFSLIGEGSDAKAILDALDGETAVNIVSSPHLMVLDNQTATLQVGDEVPLITRQQQSTATDANLVNTVEYRDTGVIMKVTPRVNASGSIIMEVEQEVSTVVPNPEEPLSPTISQRKFKSSVVVQSG
ncbi:MAG: type II secretion system secretin GspD, partial [Gammaproteobacteria bacterium]|nr:type II secretion system secretin GspD [Gammaproteobacteria bacterium]